MAAAEAVGSMRTAAAETVVDLLTDEVDAECNESDAEVGSSLVTFGQFIGNVPDLYLSHNQLSGNIPTSFAHMDFGNIDLSRNKLEGDASVIFGLNKTTQIVDLSRNLLEFNLSKVEFPTNLTLLDINHNKIYGSIPVESTQLNF